MNKSKLLLISALALAVVSCGKDGDKTTSNAASNDSTTMVANEAFESSTNIRYVVMDSISKNYVLAQNIATRAQALANDLQSEQIRLQNQLQHQYNQIQQKAQNNQYLSQASYEADMKDLEQKSNSFQNILAKKDQTAGAEMEKLQKELRDSIENFINLYNKEKKYDAILYRDAGLYFNPALDITQEVVDGLNARYTGKATGNGTAPAVDLNAPATPETPTLTNPAAGPSLK